MSTTSTSTTTTSTSTSTSTTEDPRLLGDVEIRVGVEAIPVKIETNNLWVGWDQAGMKSWKVYYAEKPYTNYILGADCLINPELFTISKTVRILTNTDIESEVRTLIQNVPAGKQYRVKVIAYKTNSQNTVDKYGTSREVYTPTFNAPSVIGSDINFLEFKVKVQ